MSRLLAGIAGIVYLAAALAYLIAVDANLEGGQVGEWAYLKGHSEWLALLGGASLAFGWAAGSWLAALLALALVPLGMPFDYPESRFGEPFPTYMYAVIVIPISAVLILLGVGVRKAGGRWHRSVPRGQEVGTNMEEQPPPKWPPWVVTILIVLGVAALALTVLAIWLANLEPWN